MMSIILSEVYEDEYGICQSMAVNGVLQKFRWIAPGDFLMGSPASEVGKLLDEDEHPVRITKGFWLADTAVTQDLWKVIMGENPSHFIGEKRPVDSVSWYDAQSFINEMNSREPELRLRLPTEAEWEYACRAGTTTPFSFGRQISPEIVNYNGAYPYNSGTKGESRGQTVEVGSLPPNNWGLYEIHGNVWEWCQDWYGDYPSGPVMNPRGPESGSDRVLRGGAWINFGRDCRSACRHLNQPCIGHRFYGFRLARDASPTESVIDPQGPNSGSERVLRGGSCFSDDGNCRSAIRNHDQPNVGYRSDGFRLARNASPTKAVIDPQGPDAGSDRVCRGGSWFNFGGNCRSAFRYCGLPDIGSENHGLRLARDTL